MQTFSKIISYIFHPLLIPTLGIVLLFNSGTYLSFLPFNAQRAIYVIVFISTFVLPISFMPFILYTERVKSIFLHQQKERIIPLIITMGFYFFAFYILTNISAPKIIRLFLLGSAISVSGALLITFFWKISMHAAGIGGLLALSIMITLRLMVDLNLLIMALIIITGIVGTSRIYLKAHTVLQVFAGMFLGFLSVFVPIQLL